LEAIRTNLQKELKYLGYLEERPTRISHQGDRWIDSHISGRRILIHMGGEDVQ
jgi:hypothetical protein